MPASHLEDGGRPRCAANASDWLSCLLRPHLRRYVPLKQFIDVSGQPLHFNVGQVGMFDELPQPFEAKQGTVLTRCHEEPRTYL